MMVERDIWQAEQLIPGGYKAIVKACAVLREAVGTNVPLMLDPYYCGHGPCVTKKPGRLTNCCYGYNCLNLCGFRENVAAG